MQLGSFFDRMRADHARVAGMVDEVEQALAGPGGPASARAELRRLCALLERQFRTHMVLEDRRLYPLLEQTLPETRGPLGPLKLEHAELRSMLASLRAALAAEPTPLGDEQIGVAARDLIDLLRIHVRKEEAVVFRVAERVLGDSALAALDAPPEPSWFARTPVRARRKGASS